VAPFSKTGGLADVAGALPAAVAGLGHEVAVVTPLYRCVDRSGLEKVRDNLDVPLAGRGQRASVWRGQLPRSEVPVYFVDCPRYFDRTELYEERGREIEDNVDRFAFFSRAALELAGALELGVDLVHCNEWQTALIPVYLATCLRDHLPVGDVRTVFTIHNLGYQGHFPRADLPRTGLPWTLYSMAGLEYYGGINLLKGGIAFADGVNTVSPTYAREIRTEPFGAGLDGVLRARASQPVGILNGVDYGEWSPDVDPHLPQRYSSRDLSGKAACKRELQRECGLPLAEVPLLAVVSRLDTHKGIDLFAEVLPELLQLDTQVVILGRGQPGLEKKLESLARTFAGRLSVHLRLDVPLSHRLLAGADLLVMPSQFEPCGLGQMYALRYGTLPVVRRTGGLADTVVDYMPSTVAAGTATGFQFVHPAPASLLKVLLLALAVYDSRPRWRRLMESAMGADFSWGRSARAYEKLYCQVLNGPRAPFPG
jgi:starch synthase